MRKTVYTKEYLINGYINIAQCQHSFSKVTVREFTDSIGISTMPVYKEFTNFRNLQHQAAKTFVMQQKDRRRKFNLANLSFEEFCSVINEMFKDYKYKKLLFTDEFCGPFLWKEYIKPYLKELFPNDSDIMLEWKYAKLIGALLLS